MRFALTIREVRVGEACMIAQAVIGEIVEVVPYLPPHADRRAAWVQFDGWTEPIHLFDDEFIALNGAADLVTGRKGESP